MMRVTPVPLFLPFRSSVAPLADTQVQAGLGFQVFQEGLAAVRTTERGDAAQDGQILLGVLAERKHPPGLRVPTPAPSRL